MHCNKCGKPLRGGDQRFCPGCGHPAPVPASSTPASRSSSHLSDPRALVLIAAIILAIVAINQLRGFSTLLAFILIGIAAIVIFRRGIMLKTKLLCLAVGLCLVLVSNGIETWHDDRAERQSIEQAKQKAAADVAADTEAKRQQALAFARLTPQEHLNKARPLLKVDSPQDSIDEAFKHLNAIGSSAPEYADAQNLRQQYEADKRKRDAEQTRIAAADIKKAVIEQAALDRTSRDSMAQLLENRLLDEGYNVDVKAIGKDHTVLHLRWILVSKVLAHQLSEDHSFFSNARSVGFKKVEITDGYDETWYWKLD